MFTGLVICWRRLDQIKLNHEKPIKRTGGNGSLCGGGGGGLVYSLNNQIKIIL